MRFEEFLIEIRHPFFFSAYVESAVTADGETPFRWGMIDFAAIFLLKFYKGLLHDITSPITISQDTRGILQKRPFEALQDLVHLRAVESNRLDAVHLSSSLTRQ